jgi:hypothetical protein
MNMVSRSCHGAPPPYARPSSLGQMPRPYRGYEPSALSFSMSMKIERSELAGFGRGDDPPEHAGAESRDALTAARSIVERQKAIVAAYPEEYVVLLGDRLIAHTPDKEEAFSRSEAAWDESEDLEPIVVPPAKQRELRGPVLRGRSIPTTRGREGR